MRVVQIDGPEPDLTRPREWSATFLPTAAGIEVLLRHDAVLAVGEDLTERTPQLWLTQAEWQRRYGEFDLNEDGTPA